MIRFNGRVHKLERENKTIKGLLTIALSVIVLFTITAQILRDRDVLEVSQIIIKDEIGNYCEITPTMFLMQSNTAVPQAVISSNSLFLIGYGGVTSLGASEGFSGLEVSNQRGITSIGAEGMLVSNKVNFTKINVHSNQIGMSRFDQLYWRVP